MGTMRRLGFMAGVIGLAVSDIGMFIRAMTTGDALWRDIVFVIAAAGALVGYTGWLLWLSAVMRHRTNEVGKGVLLDGLLIGITSAAAFAVAVVLPQMRDTDANADQLWFLGCLAADGVLLWMATAVLVTKPRSRRAQLTLAGIGLHVLVDLLHTSAIGGPGFWRIRVAEVLLLVTFGIWLTVLKVDDNGERAAEGTRRMAGFRSVGLVAALGGPGVLLAARLAAHRPDEALLFIGVVALTAALTAFRIRGLVGDLAASNAALTRQAHHDHLTGVWNRTALADHLERSQSQDIPIRAVIYLDLDGFKTVNDSFGHDAGDSVLIDVADRLRQAVRGADRVARIGGDEFVVVVTDVDTDVDAFVSRLDRVLNRDVYRWEGVELDVGVSAGVARAASTDTGTADTTGGDFDDLMIDADYAMLEAKKARKRVRVPA